MTVGTNGPSLFQTNLANAPVIGADSNGIFIVGTSGPTYSTGTFIPTMTGTTVAGSTAYTVQDGQYVQNGNLITVWITVVGTAATGTGFASIGALPFGINGDIFYNPAGPIYSQSDVLWTWPTGTTQLIALGQAGTTTIVPFGCGSAATGAPLAMANAPFNFQLTLSYTI